VNLPPMPEARTFAKSAAVVASVMLVLLVLVVSALSPRNPEQVHPLVPNEALPLAPTPTALLSAPVLAAAPAAPPPPLTSSVPLSAIPTALPPVEVIVMSTPAGATVSRDGQVLGLAPGPFALPAGSEKVTLHVAAAGYEPGDVDIVPTAGRTLNVRLQKATHRPAVNLTRAP